jgi:DNA-directed RNA polymerase subunit RPC12/RpoP
MKFNARTCTLLGLLVVGVGVSVYMWSSQSGPEVDTKIASTVREFKCTKCGASFTLTNAEAAKQRTEKGNIVCPSCGDAEAQKMAAGKVATMAFGPEVDGNEESDETPEDKPKQAVSGITLRE